MPARRRNPFALPSSAGGIGDTGCGGRVGEKGQRIAGQVVVPNLEVQIRAGGASAGPYFSDHLSARYAVAFAHEIALIMPVHRRIVIVVLNDNGVAVAMQRARKDDDAVVGGEHRSSHGSRDIDA